MTTRDKSDRIRGKIRQNSIVIIFQNYDSMADLLSIYDGMEIGQLNMYKKLFTLYMQIISSIRSIIICAIINGIYRESIYHCKFFTCVILIRNLHIVWGDDNNSVRDTGHKRTIWILTMFLITVIYIRWSCHRFRSFSS